MQKRLTRAEVPVEQTWDLAGLFPTYAAWEAELAPDLPAVTQYRGRLSEGAATLRACLDAREALYERYIRVATYAGLLASGDGSDPANQADYGRVGALEATVESSLAFIRSEILALPAGAVERYLDQEPGLADFRSYLTNLLEYRPHMLAPDTEEALASLVEVTGAPYMIYERAKSSDLAFPAFTDQEGRTLENSAALYEDDFETAPDVATRRNAFASFTQGLKAYANTLGATFATEVKKNVVLSRLRKYDSVTEMLLHPQQVSQQAYLNQLDIIQAELAPHMRRLAKLRKRVLGLDKLLYCDIEAPLDPDFNPNITYAEGVKLVLDALSALGPEYGKIMQTAMSERWVDRVDNVGKSTGAFCASPYGAHSYILMTWTDTMRNAFTLAHELGHAGHFELANRCQRSTNTEVSSYFVEAPSTCNEILLGQHILKQSNDVRMRRWVILQFLATYHHNFVRHLLEGELQRRIYAMAEEGRPITANTLSTTKGAILEQFWGDAVEIEEGARLTWMRQPHYYMGLYPYTYSAGLTVATAVAQMIREEGQPAVDRWLTVLKAGSTKKPLELMQMAGVDMTRPDSIRKAVAYVGSLIDELEGSF